MGESGRIEKYKHFMSDVLTKIPLYVLNDWGFFTAPASTKYHGAYDGGLFDHSLETAKALVELTEKLGLKWERPESPYIVGMYHDLCKCDLYVKDFETRKYTYNPDIVVPGHGDRSIIMIQKYIKLTDEEIVCIRWHMGAFDDSKNWEYYGRAVERCPLVLYTHTADMIASRIRGI